LLKGNSLLGFTHKFTYNLFINLLLYTTPQTMFTKSQFNPAWWLRNAHLQTIIAKWLKVKKSIHTTRETIELPDGDFIDLAWTEKPKKNDKRPIVVVLHGLEGSVNSHYAKGMLAAIKGKKWLGVLMHFRGCSGRVNRKANSYHSGDTRDIHYLTQQLAMQYPKQKMLAIGFSLGGNVLTKYLAQYPENPYQGVSIICAPLHLASCSKRINQGFSKVYQKYLVDMLKNSTQLKLDNHLLSSPTVMQLNDIKTIWQFDHQVTAPVNGFTDAQDYYHQSSGRYVLDKIKQPCLFIHSTDDPFLCDTNTRAIEQLPTNITFEVSLKGGHVGFIYGKNPFKPKFWLEERVPDFLEKYI
jgi:predicted alpha/beta-fold hydrolase